VRGHVASATWLVNPKASLQAITPSETQKGETLPVMFETDALELECVAQDVSSVGVFLILVGRYDQIIPWGLVLRRLPNNQFSRLGKFRVTKKDLDFRASWITQAEIRTIEIV
jgi:hypothetical protein